MVLRFRCCGDSQRVPKRAPTRSEARSVIEQWAEVSGCWVENVNNSLIHSFGEEIAEGGEAVVFDHGATLINHVCGL